MIRQFLTVCLTVLALASASARAADANKASAAELEAVKGIGPALSGKIVSARQQGQFKNWADMVERVSGMGPGNAARLSQNGLTVAGAAYTPTAAVPADKPAKDAAPKKAGKAQG